ncbi:mitochondrial glycoprotein [Radiomyces spectabilis]|uniref:mitochondrial glycoprotein n=1 Tax=Radiomyces spectabilis TaxID=64574 RepID=UPI00222045AC|nr:mitochondrial glycoprotein [Radiomyces spectabilis]KAI8379780.1 mitochondrial glycoprotein [Radiomyces spectabilis]
MASQLLRSSLRAFARPALIRKAAVPVAHRVAPAVTFAPMRSFTAGVARMNSGAVDTDLAHKLNEELQYEKSTEEAEQPEFIKEFLQNNSFQLEDKLGQDEVSLIRTFGNEKIRVLFSISDINNAAADDGFLPEEDMVEEGAEADEEEVASFPVRVSVTIEKDGKGAVTVDTVAQDGEIAIESVMFYKDGKVATEQSAEADWQRRGLYIGPQFAELDENLQNLFERYLEERGINAALASFLPDYIEYKEQKEYVQWLQNVKDFVSA